MIIIDANSIGFAATAANPDLASNGERTGGVFGTMRTLRKLREEHAGPMIALWDMRSWRHDVFPDYKANRKADPKLVAIKAAWTAQKPHVMRACKHMGVDQLMASNMEADDLAARLVRRGAKSGITLISGDKDWLQLVGKNVAWVDPIRDRACRDGGLSLMTGCETAWDFIQTKALTGDAGDNIPGVGGVGPVTAKWIFDNPGSVDALFNESIGRDALAWPKKIVDLVDSEEKRALYKRNLLLVWLNHPDVPAAANPKLVKGAVDEAKLADLAEELNLHSILRGTTAWLAPFARAQHTKETA